MLNVSCKVFSIIESDQQALCRDRMHARKGKVVSSSAENLGDRPQEEASYGQVQKRSKILSNIEEVDEIHEKCLETKCSCASNGVLIRFSKI